MEKYTQRQFYKLLAKMPWPPPVFIHIKNGKLQKCWRSGHKNKYDRKANKLRKLMMKKQ